MKGEGNQQDYGMRVYDPRLGRFLSVDPITMQYPELTPYQFASNTPIWAIDIDGLEGGIIIRNKELAAKVRKLFESDVEEAYRVSWLAVHRKNSKSRAGGEFIPVKNGKTGLIVFDGKEDDKNIIFGREDGTYYNAELAAWPKGGASSVFLRRLDKEVRVKNKEIADINLKIANLKSRISKLESDYETTIQSFDEGSAGDPGTGIKLGTIMMKSKLLMDISKINKKIDALKEQQANIQKSIDKIKERKAEYEKANKENTITE